MLRVAVARAAPDQLLLAASGVPPAVGGEVFRRADLASGVTPRPWLPHACPGATRARYALTKRAIAQKSSGRPASALFVSQNLPRLPVYPNKEDRRCSL